MTHFSPILHHHDPSPFAEKVRKAFGIKHIAWRSVQIPMVMPKPDLTALTGGYRGTPVMQVGADIYCDTRRIIAEIERCAPKPSLFGAGPLINYGLQHWSDETVFPPGAALSMHENAEHIPADVLQDREAYFSNLEFSAFEKDAAYFRNQLRAHGRLIDRQLSDGRRFLCGEAPEWSDLGAWMIIFMANGNIPSAERIFQGFDNLSAWRARMAAFGEGERTEIEADEALSIARDAFPDKTDRPAWRDETGLRKGDEVFVSPIDHPETRILGRLSYAGEDEIVILRETGKLGALAVHFPRIGYRLDASS